MITNTQKIPFSPEFLPGIYPDSSSALFFDIETTGFSFRTSMVYLIGAAYEKDGSWMFTQWMAQNDSEEVLILKQFVEFASSFKALVHFNGNRFDLPFICGRCRMAGLPVLPKMQESIDLYVRLKPLKKLLKLERMNQKTLEAFLSVSRDDRYDGGKLIPVYHSYVSNQSSQLLELLLLHNREDLYGMLRLGALFSYLNILNGHFQISSLELSEENASVFSLLITCRLNEMLPKRISCNMQHGYLSASDHTCKFQIKGRCQTLKYFFKDYKNYYYLPEEDTAIHKSISSFISREHRVQANAATCYQKKTGYFLPQSSALILPAFKASYNESQLYFECTEQFLEDPSLLITYLTSLLSTTR